jgi:hypothetical protein
MLRQHWRKQVLEWHKRIRDGQEAAGFFCSTTQLHICDLWSRSTYVRSQGWSDGFSASAVFSGLVKRLAIFFPRLKYVLKGQQFASDESNDRGIEK